MDAREAFETTIGAGVERIGAAIEMVADALIVIAPAETGIDAQAREAARYRINLRSLRLNHPEE